MDIQGPEAPTSAPTSEQIYSDSLNAAQSRYAWIQGQIQLLTDQIWRLEEQLKDLKAAEIHGREIIELLQRTLHHSIETAQTPQTSGNER